MTKRGNYPLLLASQFLGAFGDNAILALILGPVMKEYAAGRIDGRHQSVANIYYTSLLFIPYVLLAPLAGYLNDRHPKTWLLSWGNAVKLAGTAVAALSLWSSPGWQSIGYLMVGVGACFYSPAKYGILPEIVPGDRLVKANGTVEFLTLVAILTGMIGGALMVDNLPLPMGYLIVVAIYGGSVALNLLMSRTPSYPEVKLADSGREFFKNTGHLLRQPRLARVLMGTGLFWLCGAMMKMNFQPWGQQVLRLQTMKDVSLLGLWLSLGIMAGSILAGQLYKVGELHATRRYGWCLALSIGLLGSAKWAMDAGIPRVHLLVIIVLLIAGLMAGLFLIPLNASIQAESNQDKLGKTIATQNALENLAMLGGSIFAYTNVSIGFDPSQLFLALALLVGVVATALRIPQRPVTREHGGAL